MAKDTRIAFRTSGAFKERVKAAAEKVKLDETTLAEKALEAVVDYIEANGGIWLPLQVVPVPEEVARKSFEEAGESTGVHAGGPSSPSLARSKPGAQPARYRLNEEPAPRVSDASRTPRPKRSKA